MTKKRTTNARSPLKKTTPRKGARKKRNKEKEMEKDFPNNEKMENQKETPDKTNDDIVSINSTAIPTEVTPHPYHLRKKQPNTLTMEEEKEDEEYDPEFIESVDGDSFDSKEEELTFFKEADSQGSNHTNDKSGTELTDTEEEMKNNDSSEESTSTIGNTQQRPDDEQESLSDLVPKNLEKTTWKNQEKNQEITNNNNSESEDSESTDFILESLRKKPRSTNPKTTRTKEPNTTNQTKQTTFQEEPTNNLNHTKQNEQHLHTKTNNKKKSKIARKIDQTREQQKTKKNNKTNTNLTTDQQTTKEKEQHATVNTTTMIRFGFSLKIQPSEDPLGEFSKQIKQFLKFIQEQIHPSITIGIWDHQDKESQVKEWKSPKDIPKGVIADRIKFFNFFAKYVNPRKNKEEQLYLKVRFTTKQAKDLPFPLADLGKEIADSLEDKLQIRIFRNPYACQATKVTTLGWLWGSTKNLSESTLLPEIKKELKIPNNVAIGLQWRTIKNDKGRNYKWSENHKPPPQAIHIDMDEDYAPQFAGKMAKLFRKGSKKKPLSLHLRLVPCFSGYNSIAMDDKQRENTLLMAQKQHYFVNEHTTTLTSSHIQALDTPVSAIDNITLRQFLMGRAPENLCTQRLFVSVDKSWRPGNEHILVVPRIYSSQAIRILNNMIPECLFLYGEQASKWFTTTGLQAFKDVKWDRKTGKSTSQHAQETEAMVNEFDAFGMGNEWREATIPGQEIDGKISQRPQLATQQNNNTNEATVQELLTQRANSSDIKSLGSIFGRAKDDDTVATHKSVTILEQPNRNTVVEFDPMVIDLQNERDSDNEQSMGMSTAAKTTGTTRLKLKELEKLNSQLIAENAALAQAKDDEDNSVKTTVTTMSTRVKLSAAQEEIEELRKALAAQQQTQHTTAPTQEATTDAEVGGIGDIT